MIKAVLNLTGAIASTREFEVNDPWLLGVTNRVYDLGPLGDGITAELVITTDFDTFKADQFKLGVVKAIKFLAIDPHLVIDTTSGEVGHTFQLNLATSSLDSLINEVWRIYNLARWCELPERLKLNSPKPFTAKTWDQLSIYINPQPTTT